MSLEQFATNAVIVCTQMLILSLFIERSMSTVFDWRPYKARASGRGWKVPIVLMVCFLVCYIYPVDALGTLMSQPPTLLGVLLTTGFLAGGSKRIAQTIGDLRSHVEDINSSRK